VPSTCATSVFEPAAQGHICVNRPSQCQAAHSTWDRACGPSCRTRAVC
jgi:hypothetical protein